MSQKYSFVVYFNFKGNDIYWVNLKPCERISLRVSYFDIAHHIRQMILVHYGLKTTQYHKAGEYGRMRTALCVCSLMDVRWHGLQSLVAWLVGWSKTQT